ncbi:MAG: extensin family protein [Rhizobiales bacterium]|nr:extensin family protein [Hyphomicrobiales bacterium]
MSTVKLCDHKNDKRRIAPIGTMARALILVCTIVLVWPSYVSAENVPRPRTPPKSVLPPVNPSVGKFPLPRPRPRHILSKTSQTPGKPAKDPLAANRRGRLDVKLDDLGRERDPDKASELAPTTKTKWSKEQVAAARKRCDLVLAATNLDAKPIKPIGGPGGCGIAAPVRISSFGAVTVKPAAKLNCTMAAALYKWIVEEVQPAARKNFKQPVVEIQNMASYQCRSRRGVAGGRISEHSFGNALDVGSFKLANGERLTVLDDWSSTKAFFGIGGGGSKAKFLTKSHKGACSYFSTVLGPKVNKAHENHFHFDLGRAGRYKICK